MKIVADIDVLDHGNVRLVEYAGGDRAVVNAASVSYTNRKSTDRELIAKLIKLGHLSPFEHATLTFYVTCPIFVARQWMRHRIGWSYNERSLRYTEASPFFYSPSPSRPGLEDLPEYIIRELDRTNLITYEAYKGLLEDGVPREVARSVLPVGTYTEFYASTNIRALMHFYNLRSTPEAQFEITEYATATSFLASVAAPISWSSFIKHRSRNNG